MPGRPWRYRPDISLLHKIQDIRRKPPDDQKHPLHSARPPNGKESRLAHVCGKENSEQRAGCDKFPPGAGTIEVGEEENEDNAAEDTRFAQDHERQQSLLD